MSYLFDTGVLLRLFHRADPNHADIRAALSSLRLSGEHLVTSTQNLAEFWNVSTRPASARGWFGLPLNRVEARLRFLERTFRIVHESPATLGIWKELLGTHEVHGVQVHDARLVAIMASHGIENLITLNVGDFERYARRIRIHAPKDIAARHAT